MELTSWELTDELESNFNDLIKYAKRNLYAFRHGDNQDLQLEFRGYISNEPGVIIDVVNCFSFTQSEIEAYKTLFLNYGADNVRVGMDTVTRTITIYIYYNGRKEPKKGTISVGYKLLTLPRYIPAFCWIYFLLVLWNPDRYQVVMP